MVEQTPEAEAEAEVSGMGYARASMGGALDATEPPANEVPASVAFDAELLSTDGYAVFCAGLQVYSTGFRMQLELRARDRQRGARLFEVFHRDGPHAILVGIEYADGRRGRTLGSRVGPPAPIGYVTLASGGGGGREQAVHAEFFVAPLPPPGPARLVCAWPARNVGDVFTELPTDEILAAAGRVRQLWPPQPEAHEPPPEPESPTAPADSWFAT